MRIVLVIAGVALLLVAALFQYVPLAPQSVNPISTIGETPFEMFTVGGFFLLAGTIPVHRGPPRPPSRSSQRPARRPARTPT